MQRSHADPWLHYSGTPCCPILWSAQACKKICCLGIVGLLSLTCIEKATQRSTEDTRMRRKESIQKCLDLDKKGGDREINKNIRAMLCPRHPVCLNSVGNLELRSHFWKQVFTISFLFITEACAWKILTERRRAFSRLSARPQKPASDLAGGMRNFNCMFMSVLKSRRWDYQTIALKRRNWTPEHHVEGERQQLLGVKLAD